MVFYAVGGLFVKGNNSNLVNGLFIKNKIEKHSSSLILCL